MSIEYLSPKSVADTFPGLTSERLARWRWKMTGPAYSKVGRQILYRRDVLEQFVADHQVSQ
jgi:hypothetical protein